VSVYFATKMPAATGLVDTQSKCKIETLNATLALTPMQTLTLTPGVYYYLVLPAALHFFIGSDYRYTCGSWNLKTYSYATCDVTVMHDKSAVGVVETKKR